MHSIIWASILVVTGIATEAAFVPLSNSDTTDLHNIHQLWKRQDDSTKIESASPLNQKGQSLMADIFNHFGVAACGTFSGPASHSIPFPVAGNSSVFSGATTVNADGAPVCLSGGVDDIYTYGFVAGPEDSNSTPVVVNGDAFVPDPSSTDYTVKGDHCGIYPSFNSKLEFDYVRQGIYEASKYLASLSPDLRIDEHGDVVELKTPDDPCYRVITLGTCDEIPPNPTSSRDDRWCSGLSNAELSDTYNIFYSGSAWTGPNNPEIFDDAETVVINIPLTQGTTNVLATNPTLKIPACKTIYNLYVVDGDGHFQDTPPTPFNLQYTYTDSAFEGFILAYGGSIFNFESINGKIFGTEGIAAYADGDFGDLQCGEFTGCVPAFDLTSTSESTSCTPETSTEITTEISTITEGSTTTTRHTSTTTTQEHTVAETTLTVTAPATSTTVTTTTDTYTTTYTTDGSTTTNIVTTTKPVFVPVQNDFGHEYDDGNWKHKDDWKKDDGDWKKDDGDWKKDDGGWKKGDGWNDKW